MQQNATGILDPEIPCAAEQASIDVAAPQLVGDSQWITHIFYRDGVRYGLTCSRTTIPPRSDLDGFSYGPMLFRAPTRRHSRGIRSPKVDLFGWNRPRPGIRARRLSANIRGIAEASRSASKAAAILICHGPRWSVGVPLPHLRNRATQLGYRRRLHSLRY